MARILVKTPLTTNGTNPVMDGGKLVYSVSILQATAKKILEKDNTQQPEHLRKIIIDIPDTITSEDPKEIEELMTKTKPGKAA